MVKLPIINIRVTSANLRMYFVNLLIWLDNGFNVVFFAGSPYETMSSRVGKRAEKGERWACKVCAWLDKWLGKAHCKSSKVEDYGRTLPRE